MNTAVALVQAYLQVNGYFTVAEYPVLEALRHGGTRTATDVDILAFRFPNAGCEVAHGRRRARSSLALEPDPTLGVPPSSADMTVGEVKAGVSQAFVARASRGARPQGARRGLPAGVPVGTSRRRTQGRRRAGLRRAARSRMIRETPIKEGPAQFNPAARDPLVLEAALVRSGCCSPDLVSTAVKELLTTGRAATPASPSVRMIAFGSTGNPLHTRHAVITLGHIVSFLRAHLRTHWRDLGRARFSQPALASALIEKAERGAPTPRQEEP